MQIDGTKGDKQMARYEVTLDIDFKVAQEIVEVIFHNPGTTVKWNDGTEITVRCMEGDVFDKDNGLNAAIARKVIPNRTEYKKLIENAIVVPDLMLRNPAPTRKQKLLGRGK